MDYTVVIPARYASTRLPGKPLVDIGGKPMIQWVYEQAGRSSARQVVIATDDERVATAARDFGAEPCMTRVDHESGTDRLAETAAALGLAGDAIVVNVQGDEPMVPPAIIDQVAANLAANPAAGIATLAVPITEASQFVDPNAVKVVCDNKGFALYFSRAPIPWPRDEMSPTEAALPNAGAMRHLGIYAYRVSFLQQFVGWPQGALEGSEKLEQLRAMENGVRIHVAAALEEPAAGIDTAEDLARVRALIGGAQ